MIDVLVADDEAPALAELVHLLRADPRIGEIVAVGSGAEALRVLSERTVQVAFLDIHMPGVDGVALAAALRGLSSAPAVVFVTADDARAIDAFDLRAADYVLKPVRAERLRRAPRPRLELAGPAPDDPDDETGAGDARPVAALRAAPRRALGARAGRLFAVTPTTGRRTSCGCRSPSSTSGGRAGGLCACTGRTWSPRRRSARGAGPTGAEPAVVVRVAASGMPVSIPVSRRMLPAVRDALLRARAEGR